MKPRMTSAESRSRTILYPFPACNCVPGCSVLSCYGRTRSASSQVCHSQEFSWLCNLLDHACSRPTFELFLSEMVSQHGTLLPPRYLPKPDLSFSGRVCGKLERKSYANRYNFIFLYGNLASHTWIGTFSQRHRLKQIQFK